MKMMRFLLLTIVFLNTSCFENQNSNSNDDGGLVVNPGDSAEFIAAKTIFASECNGCHAYASKTEAQFLAEGLVVPGDPENSQIYNSLQGSSGPLGNKDMPDGRPALDSGELQIIFDWVTSVTP
jgi:hypothetical protein